MVEARSNYHTYVRGAYVRVPQKPPLRTLLAASKAHSNNFFEQNFRGNIRWTQILTLITNFTT